MHVKVLYKKQHTHVNIIDHLTSSTNSWVFQSLISQGFPIRGLLYYTYASTFITYNPLSWFLRLEMAPDRNRGENAADFYSEKVTLSPSFLIPP